jgi:nitroreductase
LRQVKAVAAPVFQGRTLKQEIDMDVIEAITHRRSVRAYTDAPVAKKTLEELVQAAILAPSAVNAQPWHFTIIQNAALLYRISGESKALMLKAIDQAPAPHAAAIRAHLTDPDFHVFYHAPAVILISAVAGDWATEDAALAAQNLMLAAYAQGLGSCWIGFAQKWLETPEGKEAVQLSSQYQPIAPIIIGHPKGETPFVPRLAPPVHWIA